jgi:hypothetical protein
MDRERFLEIVSPPRHRTHLFRFRYFLAFVAHIPTSATAILGLARVTMTASAQP